MNKNYIFKRITIQKYFTDIVQRICVQENDAGQDKDKTEVNLDIMPCFREYRLNRDFLKFNLFFLYFFNCLYTWSLKNKF
jgi:hypothetical protein